MFRGNNAEGRSASLPPALIGLDELQLVIPCRVGLHQSPPPLHQPADSMRYSRSARRGFFSEQQAVSYSLVSGQGSTAWRGLSPNRHGLDVVRSIRAGRAGPVPGWALPNA